MIENLENIKKFGIREFVKNEKIRWACSQCGGTICVHRGYCYNCGKQKTCDILPVMNDGASYETRFAVVGSKSNEVCCSR